MNGAVGKEDWGFAPDPTRNLRFLDLPSSAFGGLGPSWGWRDPDGPSPPKAEKVTGSGA